MSKYVGDSEENIRRLLTNWSDQLKIVFFDEFDCLAKERTSNQNPGSQVTNNIVNQILAMMDGVNTKNNILIIAATNRIDTIDKALLRPGRFGLCLYIGLPTQTDRLEIFNIHLAKNKLNDSLDKDVCLKTLAELTEHYSGADIKGVCKKAKELALAEVAPDLSKLDQINVNKLILTKRHFEEALKLVKSSFIGNIHQNLKLLPQGEGNKSIINNIIKHFDTIKPSSRIYTSVIVDDPYTYKSTSCRVLCEYYKNQFDVIIIVTQNLIQELNQIDLTLNKSYLIILDSLENLCSLLNKNSYNHKVIDYLNQFVNTCINNKIIVLATIRTTAFDLFSIVNPTFSWCVKF